MPEFEALLKEQGTPYTATALTEAWHRYDTDQSGTMDRAEFDKAYAFVIEHLKEDCEEGGASSGGQGKLWRRGVWAVVGVRSVHA